MAGVAALRGDMGSVRAMIEEFHRRRDLIVDGLNAIPGFRCTKPRGAFYVFVNVSDISRDSHSLAFDILEKARVAVTPGIDFGQGGEGYMRFSYAASVADIEEGMRRLGKYLNARKSVTQ